MTDEPRSLTEEPPTFEELFGEQEEDDD